MRYVFSGLEKLQNTTRQLWSERFGLRIFEGYGATETGPMLSMNTPMDNQPGTAGCFLPGIEYKLTPVPDLAGQRLWVRGPNVMLGYYTAQQPGVLQTPGVDDWHDSGDRVSISAAGHVSLLGRVKPLRETTA
jgi:acyl-[acyl-carrier-protein]-phospholipid O-acyltransferase/long-chain-fatty-acid--[acyl-carrier-protein] ligase